MSRSAAVVVGLVTVALGIVLAVGVPHPGLAARAYAAAVGCILVASLVRQLSRDEGWDASLAGDDAAGGEQGDTYDDAAVLSWLELELALRLGSSRARDFDLRVRPRLAALALARAAQLEAAQRAAAQDGRAEPDVLGPMSILSPDSPRLAEGGAPGVALEDVSSVVECLEHARWS